MSILVHLAATYLPFVIQHLEVSCKRAEVKRGGLSAQRAEQASKMRVMEELEVEVETTIERFKEKMRQMGLPSCLIEVRTKEEGKYWQVFFANDVSLEISEESVTKDPDRAAKGVWNYYSVCVRQ